MREGGCKVLGSGGLGGPCDPEGSANSRESWGS